MFFVIIILFIFLMVIYYITFVKIEQINDSINFLDKDIQKYQKRITKILRGKK